MFQIMMLSYWEHVKAEKELARTLPPTDKRRIDLNKAANEILEKVKSVEQYLKEV